MRKENLELLQEALIGLRMVGAISGDCPGDSVSKAHDSCVESASCAASCALCWQQVAAEQEDPDKAALATLCLEVLDYLGVYFMDCHSQANNLLLEDDNYTCDSGVGDRCFICWHKAIQIALEELKKK